MPGRAEDTPRVPRRRTGRAGVVAAIVAALLLVVGGCNWTQRGDGPGHGYFNSAETSLTPSTVTSLHVAYRAQLPVVASGDPIVFGGRAYVAGVDGTSGTPTATVAARSSGSGAAAWTTTVPGAVTDVSDVASDGTRVFVAAHGDDGSVTVLALAGSTGATEWTTTAIAAPSGDGFTSISPVLTVVGQRLVLSGEVSDGTVDALTHRQVVLGLDVSSGAVAWTQQRTVRDPRGSRVVGVAGGNIAWVYEDALSDTSSEPAYVTSVLNATDGSVVWTQNGATGARAIAAAAANGDRLVGDLGPAAFPDGSGGVLDAATGSVVWHGAPSGVAPLVASATAAIWPVPDANGLPTALRSYALSDGTVGWSTNLPAGSVVRSASVAGSVLYAVTDDGPGLSLRTYDVGTGATLTTVTLSSDDQSQAVVGSPIVDSGRVYLAVDDQLVSLTG